MSAFTVCWTLCGQESATQDTCTTWAFYFGKDRQDQASGTAHFRKQSTVVFSWPATVSGEEVSTGELVRHPIAPVECTETSATAADTANESQTVQLKEGLA